MWENPEAERLVDSGSYWVLTQASVLLTVDARETVETFCLFFRNGSVEDVLRVENQRSGSSGRAVCGRPGEFKLGMRSASGIFESIAPTLSGGKPHIRAIYSRVNGGKATQAWSKILFLGSGQGLQSVRVTRTGRRGGFRQRNCPTKIAFTGLLRGRDYLDSFFRGRDAAGQGGLRSVSFLPYHFSSFVPRSVRRNANKYRQLRRLANVTALLRLQRPNGPHGDLPGNRI